jgi:hypothetical protein
VAAIRAGLVFDTVSAVPDDELEVDGALYWTELQELGEVAMAPELMAVVSLAGPCAEARALGRRDHRVIEDFEAGDDREAVATLGLTETQFMTAYREARDLVDQDWAIIERIADELASTDYLTYEEVEEIVHRADN